MSENMGDLPAFGVNDLICAEDIRLGVRELSSKFPRIEQIAACSIPPSRAGAASGEQYAPFTERLSL